MRAVPEPYTAPPAGVTPGGFLLWITRMQWTTVVQGTVCDIIWLLGLALTPWAIGRAIDEGLVAGDFAAFLRWLAVVIWLQLQHSLIQGLRDRAGSVNFERASSRVSQVIARASTRVTVAADQKLPAGAMVTVASSDSWAISFIPINVGSLISSLVAFITVSALLLRDSLLLGLLVVVGVPAFALVQFALVKSLHKRQWIVRKASEQMNAVAADSVKGMRVLRGIGGEEQFLSRFRTHSSQLGKAAKKASWPLAAAEGLNVLIAGILVATLTWIGAGLVAQGDLQVGELVSFYGYAGFMMMPVALFNQVLRVVVSGFIGARKVVDVLEVDPLWAQDGESRASDAAAEMPALVDERTGVTVRDGELLAVVIPNSSEAREFVDRLGRMDVEGKDADEPDAVAPAVRLHGDSICRLPIEQVRSAVVVSDPVPFLFSGTLRSVLDPWAQHDDDALLRAVRSVDALDVIESVDGGLGVLVGEGGIEFSGGQRQRLGAARALLSEPEVLVLHDPTSSVDAATEERMADGIRSHRRGRTTIIVTSSPLVLSVADRVALVIDGEVRADGTHDELLRRDGAYVTAVLRAQPEPAADEKEATR
ncbi:ABC transporter transmembrane domain-containing protein [Microbacterium murale]|uniref:Multidrug ABC transporter permease n=1 Tax=Microbacterium murale TaxID=1081040 RepID=A0ABQ1RFM2_9MICO|nr:ABC transporter ATP-binding protein [Microbacterium murale]GGD65091.1 multidrug ABC transporter permease [Microbacterium murale]